MMISMRQRRYITARYAAVTEAPRRPIRREVGFKSLVTPFTSCRRLHISASSHDARLPLCLYFD